MEKLNKAERILLVKAKNFKDLMTVFLRCMARAYKSGGLYCNGIVSEHTFGSVRWCEDDVKSAMELREIPLTDENISKAVTAVENNHYLRDAMIERGWEVIDYILNDEFPET